MTKSPQSHRATHAMNYSDKLIQTYHGCRDGWKTVTSRPASDADRFVKVLSLVRPHFIHRAI